MLLLEGNIVEILEKNLMILVSKLILSGRKAKKCAYSFS